jgi:hypothetical protein
MPFYTSAMSQFGIMAKAAAERIAEKMNNFADGNGAAPEPISIGIAT